MIQRHPFLYPFEITSSAPLALNFNFFHSFPVLSVLNKIVSSFFILCHCTYMQFFASEGVFFIFFFLRPFKKYPGLRGEGELPSTRLLGMCRWMGSHFHNWTDYNGVTFLVELLEWGRMG